MEGSLKCDRCWGDSYEEEFAVLTYRGFWLEHQPVLCDKRKVYICESSHEKDGHCACDGYGELEVLGSDNGTCNYDGSEHEFTELDVLVSKSEKWCKEVIELLKSKQTLTSKTEILWSMIMYSSIIPRQQLKLPNNPFQGTVFYTAQMELASNYKEWQSAKRSLIKGWENTESLLDPSMAAIARRLLMEYICGRCHYRVTGTSENNIAPPHIKDYQDPIIKQMVGGSWNIFGYIEMDTFSDPKILKMENSGWVDLVAGILNNWGSLHRDFSDGTLNNSIHYYKDSNFSISEDLFAILSQSISISGANVRSVLALIDLHDQTSRYKFTENYWHCVSKGRKPLSIQTDIRSRLIPFYKECINQSNSEYDVYCYCLQLTVPELASDQNLETSDCVHEYPELYRALADCLDKKTIDTFYHSIINGIKETLELQEQSFQASQNHNHSKIKEIGLRYRQLRIRQWSLELNQVLPIGGNLIIIYHVSKWLLDHKFNVDSGYKALHECKFEV